MRRTRKGGVLRRIGIAASASALIALAVVGATSARVGMGKSQTGAVSLLAETPTPILIDGAANRTCDELDEYGAPGASWTELKVDSGELPSVGNTVTKSDSYVTITLTRTDTDTWAWTSSQGIDAVFVKSGVSGHNLYVYDPP